MIIIMMANETQKAIFLRPISSNMRQAAQWDAQKWQNLLYFVSLNIVSSLSIGLSEAVILCWDALISNNPFIRYT